MLRRAFLIVVIVVASGCKPAKKNPNVLDGGEIKYAVSGMDRGVVTYGVGVRRQDASSIGDWLKDKGWFVTRPENRSILSGKAKSSINGGTGPGVPLAKIATRGDGLEVVVYASAQDVEATDVVAFGAESADELKKRVSKPVRFVIRSETKKGKTLEWTDTFWDSEDAQARSNGK